MTEQKVLPCEFTEGSRIHCGDTEMTSVHGDCEGWIEPEFLQTIRVLTTERDALAAQLETMRYELDAIPAIKAERDALLQQRDDLQHIKDRCEVERDALTAANKDLQAWFDALMTDHEALKAELEIARMVPYVAAMSEIAKERDALKAAARLALVALESLFGVPAEHTGVGGGGVAVWRLGGSDQPRQAIAALKEVL